HICCLWREMLIICLFLFFFFFQAEDGIRDRNVTGVQTCALPILFVAIGHDPRSELLTGQVALNPDGYVQVTHPSTATNQDGVFRSEERRVGKECRSRWWTSG